MSRHRLDISFVEGTSIKDLFFKSIKDHFMMYIIIDLIEQSEETAKITYSVAGLMQVQGGFYVRNDA